MSPPPPVAVQPLPASPVKGPANLSTVPRDAGEPASAGYRITLLLWILLLFEPARTISHYIPALGPLKWIPELLLYGGVVVWLASPQPKRHIKWFTVFFALTLLGTVVAFLFGNWGLARQVVRRMFQHFGLGILTVTFVDTPRRAEKVLLLYFTSVLYYGLWGLLSLGMEPIQDEIDPGVRQIVFWHNDFNNRDGFGPLMVMGLAYNFYFYQLARTRFMKWLAVASGFLCIVGFLTSFGRGVFLASLVTIAYIWARARRKFLGVLVIVLAVFVFGLVAPNFSERYFASMETIFTQGTRTGSGADRRILWGWAWKEFLSSPIVGVGTGNFGIAIFNVVSPQEIASVGYTSGRLWGRALHSAPMTVLAEYGLLGVIAIVMLLADFIRKNRRIRRAPAPAVDTTAGPARAFTLSSMTTRNLVARAFAGAFVGLCAASFFYEILYTQLLWNLVTLNAMVYWVTVGENGSAPGLATRRPSPPPPPTPPPTFRRTTVAR